MRVKKALVASNIALNRKKFNQLAQVDDEAT